MDSRFFGGFLFAAVLQQGSNRPVFSVSQGSIP
jgi:hypothetical protein